MAVCVCVREREREREKERKREGKGEVPRVLLLNFTAHATTLVHIPRLREYVTVTKAPVNEVAH